ncbi:MAG: NAD(P)/FAD-dependent oxidoreductase [Gammaproteobacteria bacterium]
MTDSRKRIAIIGGGISGLTAARRLDDEYDVTLYEAADYPGGHTRTLTVEHEGRDRRVDIGFIVFNDWTYPNFIALLDELGVASEPTSMGFSMSDERSGLEYRGGSWSGLFAQKRNALRPSFYRMLRDISRFFRDGKAALSQNDTAMTLGEFLERNRYGDLCVQQFVLPMAAAIWSTEPARVRDFPAAFFLRFFENHGLLNIADRPVWRVVKGGSASYVTQLLSQFKGALRLSDPVHSVTRGLDQVTIDARSSGRESFDYVVFGCHSDQALAMIDQPTADESQVLGSMAYQDNEVVLHTDTRLLPRARRAWAAWNYHRHEDQSDAATLTYNMNILQHLGTATPLCVTLNARDRIDPSSILHTTSMAHPLYTESSVAAQAKVNLLNGHQRSFYCGAYWGNGFHEDGVVSALRAVDALKEYDEAASTTAVAKAQ